jgi:hypothetical protein
MNKSIARLLAVTLSAGVAALMTPAWGQQPAGPEAAKAQAMHDKLRTDRKGVVLRNMKLTEAQSARFVPVYDAYERSLTDVNRKLTRVGVDYVNMGESITDGQAKQLAKDLLAFEDADAKLRRTTYGKVAKAIGEKKAIRFLQIENKIRAVLRYDMAATIPLVD